MNSKYYFILILGIKGWILSIISIIIEGYILYLKTQIFYVSNGVSMNSTAVRLKAKILGKNPSNKNLHIYEV